MATEKAKIILEAYAQGLVSVDEATNKIQKLGTKTGETSKLFKKFELAATAAAAAVVYLAKQKVAESIKIFSEFETGITNVYTLLDKNTFAKFGKQIETGTIGILKDFGFEMNDVTKALFDSVSAGIEAGNSTEFLRKAAVLAQGGVTSLGVAVNGMTSIINAYGLEQEEATRVANAFFTAQKYGKTTVEELANNIGKVAPIAAAAGISFEELLSATSQLTLSGISTDEAVTALKGTISALIRPLDESREYFDALGIPVGKAAFEGGKLGDTMKKIMVASEGNIDVIAELIPNIRALLGTTSMATEQGLKKYDMILNDVKTDTESLSLAFEKQQNTLTNVLGVYKNRMNVELIKTGSVLAVVIGWLDQYNKALVTIKNNIVDLAANTADYFLKLAGFVTKQEADQQRISEAVAASFEQRAELRDLETIAIQEHEDQRASVQINAIEMVNQKKAAAEEAEKARKAAAKAAEKEEAKLQKQQQKEKEKSDKEAKDREIAREQYLADAKENIFRNTGSVFMDLYYLFGEKYRALFEISKAAAYAETVVQTYRGVTAAIASMAGAGPVGWIAGAIQAAAQLAGGLANAARIRAQEMEFGGIIPGSAMGTPIIAGEKGKSEAIIPLDEGTQQQLGISGGNTIIMNIENLFADDSVPYALAAAIDEALERRRVQGDSVFGNGLKTQLGMGV